MPQTPLFGGLYVVKHIFGCFSEGVLWLLSAPLIHLIGLIWADLG
jgi:hypothetical protein